jgi:tripartite-type tricarboxylate transporter receptor subunit TctC
MVVVLRCLLLWACIVQADVHAQTPLRIIVGFPPGGGADVVARLVGERMRESTGVGAVIENRPGAGGQIAARYVKGLGPDAGTLMVTAPSAMTMAAVTHRQLDYDPVTDFAPVSLAASFQLVLAVGPGSPARSVPEYVEWVRGDPGRFAFGSAASGSLPHLFGLLLGRRIDVAPLHVPYNGGAPLLTAVAGGQIPAGLMLLSEALPMHQAGKIRILASSGTGRSPLADSVPTFSELGFKDIVGGGWIAFYAPPNTAKGAIEKWSAAIAEAVRHPEVARKLVSSGFEPVGSTPEALARAMAADLAQWRPIAQSFGVVTER